MPKRGWYERELTSVYYQIYIITYFFKVIWALIANEFFSSEIYGTLLPAC